ncbi:TPA: FkbM family methyltransferase [Escherichia coli]
MGDDIFKISVILPVYGGEVYLEQCLDSVLSQTYKNLEIIIVNDGSPDACPQIIDRYASSDTRIIAIHKKNAGYGAAINSGLDVASGDFISIIETDDWVQLDMFERLIDAYNKIPNPVIKASFNRISNEVVINTQSLAHLCTFDNDNLAEIVPENSVELFLLESSIWTGLYRRDFLEENHIRFYESPGASYQDMPFKFITYASVEKITLLNVPVYNYRVMNVGSSSASADKALISFNNYDIIKKHLLSVGTFQKYLNHFYFHHLFDLVFHSSRLRGDGLKSYQEAAIAVFEQAKEEGFQPVTSNVSFSSDTNDYYYNHVLPIYNELMSNRIIKTVQTRNRIKKKVVSKLRFITNKLIIEPIINAVSSKMDSSSSLLSKHFREELDSSFLKMSKELTDKVDVISGQNKNGSVLIKVAPTNQFYYYMKVNSSRISKLREEFKRGLDEFSLQNERKLFGFYELLPYFEHQGIELELPLSLTLFTDEDRVILSNIDSILRHEKELIQHLDLSEVPVTLATNYFKAGLKYLPGRFTEEFKGSVAIDCGAWVGDTAIMFASFGFKEVLALEAVADNYNCMVRNLERNHQYLNDTIKPLNVAVSNVSGELSMMKVGDDGVGSCVVEDEQSDIKVQSVTIDSLTFEDRVGLIKFDIEGYEINALNGAIETIKKHKPVLLISVYHLWLQPEQIFECKKFVENLNMGYQFKFVHLQPERDLVYEYMLVCW